MLWKSPDGYTAPVPEVIQEAAKAEQELETPKAQPSCWGERSNKMCVPDPASFELVVKCGVNDFTSMVCISEPAAAPPQPLVFL